MKKKQADNLKRYSVLNKLNQNISSIVKTLQKLKIMKKIIIKIKKKEEY